jgi:hypothetical protein
MIVCIEHEKESDKSHLGYFKHAQSNFENDNEDS